VPGAVHYYQYPSRGGGQWCREEGGGEGKEKEKRRPLFLLLPESGITEKERRVIGKEACILFFLLEA